MGQTDFQPYDKEISPLKDIDALHIAVLRTEWNDDIVSKLQKSCIQELLDLGIKQDHIYQYSVPGSFELPLAAKMTITSTLKLNAVICLGCVIQGATKHDDYINHTVARSINNLGLVSGLPVIFGVLTTNTKEQAMARADGSKGDKGRESAIAALKMISLKERLSSKEKRIGF